MDAPKAYVNFSQHLEKSLDIKVSLDRRVFEGGHSK